MRDRLLPCPAARPDVLTIRPLPGRTGLALSGEADFTARDTLHAALAALPAGGTGEIHLDLTGLRFIDVCCTRELIAVTNRHHAMRLVAHHPPASLLRIIDLLYPQASIEFDDSSGPLPPAVSGRNEPARADGGDGRLDGSIAGEPQRPGDITAPDVTRLITGERAVIRRLFTRLDHIARDRQQETGSAAVSTGDRTLSEIWAVLVLLPRLHIDAEEEICYPAIAATGPPEGLLDAVAADHWDIHEALAEAQLSKTGSRQWWRAVTDARWAVIRHFQAEENHLLAAFRRDTGPEARHALGRQWIAFILARLRDGDDAAEK
jgi:STAS domain/Hemerythrin HHE cation binding domain